jgi:hypothetical protein
MAQTEGLSHFWHPMLHPNEMTQRVPIRIVRAPAVMCLTTAGIAWSMASPGCGM